MSKHTHPPATHEHWRNPEDAELHHALHTLTGLGLLIPIQDAEIFHGRAGSAAEDAASWTPDPAFVNPKTNNANNRPAFYAGSRAEAEEFAGKRVAGMAILAFEKAFQDKVRAYTDDQRQEWLARANEVHQRWYDAIDPSDKKAYQHLLDEDGSLRPLTLDAVTNNLLEIMHEAEHLEDATPEAERNALREHIAAELRADVHKIVATDSDATIMDVKFDASLLSAEQTERYEQALRVLAEQTPAAEGLPADFEDYETIQPFTAALAESGRTDRLIPESEVAQIAGQAGIDKQIAMQLASAHNASHLARTQPIYLVDALMERTRDMFVGNLEVDGKNQPVPISLVYVLRYMQNAHIAGVRQLTESGTLDDRTIATLAFLDVTKLTTDKALKAARATSEQAE